MAKKVVVAENASEENAPKKRKRNKCCTCCLVALIAVVIILAAAFCVGWFLGDKYTKQYIGLSMKDTFGVVNGLYYAKDKKVVKNPYGEEDLDNFYGQIKTNILLKEDADVDFDASLTEAINGMIADKAQSNTAIERKNADGTGSGSAVSSIGDILGDMMSEVFTRENIDIVKLKEYSEENDEYVFDLQDKGLAAFIDSVLGSILDSGAIELPEMLGDVNLSEYIKLKQIIFKAESTTNELGENTISATTADVTLWVGLQGAAGQVLKGVTESAGVGWAGGIAGFLGNVILPKNLYATVTIPLVGEAEPQFTINNMNEKKRENTYKLVNGVLGLTGSDMTVQGFMSDTMSTMKPMLDSIAQKANFESAAQGSIKFDLIQTLTDVVNSSLGGEDPLTKADFMYLLQALLTSDPEVRRTQLQPYLYNGWYRSEADAQATPVFEPSDKTGLKEINYEDEFVKEIEKKYCIDFGDKPLKDVLSMLGISLDGNNTSAGSSDLLKQINTARFHEALNVPDENISSLDLEMTDRMLAAAFDGELNGLLTGAGSGLENLNVNLDAITFVTKPDRPDRMYALLAVDVDVRALVGGGDSMLGKLAGNILPEKIFLTIYSDVSKVPKDERDAPSFEFNDYTNTDRVVDTLSKLVSGLDLSSMCKQIDDMLFKMIDELNKKLSITLVPSVVTETATTQGAIVMPNIFEVVANTVIVDENKNPVVNDVRFKNVVKGLENVDGIDSEKKIAENYSGFLGDVTDKYYLNPASPLNTFDDLTNFVNGGVNKDKFRFKDKVVKDGGVVLHPLVHDNRTPDKLKPAMSGAEIGALIAEKMTGDASINQKFEILSVKVTDGGMDVLLAIDIANIMPDTVKTLITANRMYVTAKFDTDTVKGDGTAENPFAYDVSLSINNMDESTHNDALLIVSTLDKSVKIDEQIKNFGKLLYDTLNNLTKSMDADGKLGKVFEFKEEKTVDGVKTGGLELIDFYSFLGGKLGLTMDTAQPDHTDPKKVQKAVQGMYERESYYNNPNNYVADVDNHSAAESILVNKPTADVDYTSVLGQLTGGNPVDDKDFNGFFSNIGKAAGDADSGVSAAQTLVLAGGNDASVRTWLSGRVSPINPAESTGEITLNSGSSYLMITFKLVMSKFLGSNDAGSATFLPDNVYATVVYEKIAGGEFTQLGIVFNNMDAATYSTMFKLMKLDSSSSDDETVNIFSIAKDSAKILNDLRVGGKDFTLAAQTDATKGFGTVKYGND